MDKANIIIENNGKSVSIPFYECHFTESGLLIPESYLESINCEKLKKIGVMFCDNHEICKHFNVIVHGIQSGFLSLVFENEKEKKEIHDIAERISKGVSILETIATSFGYKIRIIEKHEKKKTFYTKLKKKSKVALKFMLVTYIFLLVSVFFLDYNSDFSRSGIGAKGFVLEYKGNIDLNKKEYKEGEIFIFDIKTYQLYDSQINFLLTNKKVIEKRLKEIEKKYNDGLSDLSKSYLPKFNERNSKFNQLLERTGNNKLSIQEENSVISNKLNYEKLILDLQTKSENTNQEIYQLLQKHFDLDDKLTDLMIRKRETYHIFSSDTVLYKVLSEKSALFLMSEPMVYTVININRETKSNLAHFTLKNGETYKCILNATNVDPLQTIIGFPYSYVSSKQRMKECQPIDINISLDFIGDDVILEGSVNNAWPFIEALTDPITSIIYRMLDKKYETKN